MHKCIAKGVGLVLKPGATYDPDNFRSWEQRGVHITPVHFYSPIPDTRELARRGRRPPRASGIDLRQSEQLQFLVNVIAPYQEECRQLVDRVDGLPAFPADNPQFGGIDPFVYYAMIRHFAPREVVEVGSGFSTIVGARATHRGGGAARYTCIDPWAPAFVKAGIPGVTLLPQRVEDVDIEWLLRLKRNDILFIDSSHVVKTGGDVAFLVLEVLPRLAPGVVVHFHDIYLPHDYPDELLLEQHMFWAEQYLLQAYLAENPRTEVLFSSHYMAAVAEEAVRRSVPHAMWVGGASFWFRKC